MTQLKCDDAALEGVPARDRLLKGRKLMMEYKGYHAEVCYSYEDKLFIGEIYGINDKLGFHGSSVEELESMFHQSVDHLS